MRGIWVTPEQVQAIKEVPADAPRVADLTNQDDNADIANIGAAIRARKTDNLSLTTQVQNALRQTVKEGLAAPVSPALRALTLGRNLQAIIVSADLVDLDRDPAFCADIDRILRRATSEGGSVIACQKKRPNNWGTHCGAATLLGSLLTNDLATFRESAAIWKGWMGDRTVYSDFTYGNLSWQFDPTKPVGINPLKAVKQLINIDGVLPDDQRRGGNLTDNPPNENYVYEALQGATVAVYILSTHSALLPPGWGPAYDWSDRALLRAYDWEYHVNGYTPGSDDGAFIHVLNHMYGEDPKTGKPFPNATSSFGKGMGFMHLTHPPGSRIGQLTPLPPDPGEPPPDPPIEPPVPLPTDQVVTQGEVAALVAEIEQQAVVADQARDELDNVLGRAREWLGRFK